MSENQNVLINDSLNDLLDDSSRGGIMPNIDPILSLIVPVYNAEAALRRCVDSILGQELGELELILVDDGSTDGSPEICDTYAKKDPRVRIIHKENSGVSDSRNLGLSEARGKYIQFVDSDDWISNDASYELVMAAEEHDCDMVISDFYRVVGKRIQQKGSIDEGGVFSREQYASYMMENPADFYYGVLWNKLYRRDIIEEHQLRMQKDVSWCEDFMFNLEYLLHVKTVFAVQKPLYYYVKTKGSLVSQSMSLPKLVRMKAAVFEYYNDFYKNIFTPEEYEKARIKVYSFLIDSAGDGFSPVIGSRKLEAEPVSEAALSGEGIFLRSYRYLKLFEKLTEEIRQRYDLDMDEIRLLICLRDIKDESFTRAELGGITDTGVIGITKSLATLSLKKLIRYKDIVPSDRDYSLFGPRLLKAEFLEESIPLMKELDKAMLRFRDVCLSELSEDDRKRLPDMLLSIDEAVTGYLSRSSKAGEKSKIM